MIARPAAVLILLTALNYLNYLDRYVLAAVLPRVQESLGLSNFYAGLLYTVFLLGYFLTAPIFGALADKSSRKVLILVGIVVWSLATIASGMSTSPIALLIARAMVGVGEASYATIAPTVIDDIAPAEKKGKYLSIFFLATSVGSASGYLVGGAAEKAFGWRGAFFVAGVPGLVLALVTLFLKEPPRTIYPKTKAIEAAVALARVPLYRVTVAGYCAYTAALGAFAYWAPKYLHARYDMTLAKANYLFGLVTVLGGILGTLIGGVLADRQALRAAEGRPEPAVIERRSILGYLRICSICTAMAAPLAAVAFWSPGPTLFFAAAGLAEVLLFVTTSPVNLAILRSAPPAYRASAMAVAIFAIHLLGDLWSPPLVGLIADHAPLWLAMMTLPAGIALAGYLWWPKRRIAA